MFKKIWKAIDGSKTTIGLVLWTASDYAGGLNLPLKIAAVIVGGVGVADKGRKINKAIKGGE